MDPFAAARIRKAGRMSASDVTIGRVGKGFGRGGEFLADPLGPLEDFLGKEIMLRLPGGAVHNTVIVSMRPHGKRFRILFGLEPGIDPRGAEIIVSRDSLAEPIEGEFYHFDLIGMEVIDENEESLGRISRIEKLVGSDVWVFNDDSGRESSVAAVRDFIIGLDLVSGTVRVRRRGVA